MIHAILSSFILLSLLTPLAAKPFTNGACAIDDEEFLLPACALETKGDQLFVAAPFTKFLFAHSKAKRRAYVLEGYGWSWFDRSGHVLVTHVAVMDNGASDFHHGLVRVTENGKWGLADAHGRLVVPMIYDGMYDWQEGKGWEACTDCVENGDGENRWFEGETPSIFLDRHGKAIGR